MSTRKQKERSRNKKVAARKEKAAILLKIEYLHFFKSHLQFPIIVFDAFVALVVYK